MEEGSGPESSRDEPAGGPVPTVVDLTNQIQVLSNEDATSGQGGQEGPEEPEGHEGVVLRGVMAGDIAMSIERTQPNLRAQEMNSQSQSQAQSQPETQQARRPVLVLDAVLHARLSRIRNMGFTRRRVTEEDGDEDEEEDDTDIA